MGIRLQGTLIFPSDNKTNPTRIDKNIWLNYTNFSESFNNLYD